MYDLVMTGMSSTCIVHLFSHFLPLSFIYVVANGVVGMGRLWSFYLLWLLAESGRLCPDYTCINSSI
jgi:hypothetical protein